MLAPVLGAAIPHLHGLALVGGLGHQQLALLASEGGLVAGARGLLQQGVQADTMRSSSKHPVSCVAECAGCQLHAGRLHAGESHACAGAAVCCAGMCLFASCRAPTCLACCGASSILTTVSAVLASLSGAGTMASTSACSGGSESTCADPASIMRGVCWSSSSVPARTWPDSAAAAVRVTHHARVVQ
jgi:hypothetical protein